MSSIKVKGDIGNWITFGGTTTKEDINWIPVASSTQIVPAIGGYYSIGSTVNDQGYTFIILPAAPANGTIIGVQVLDESTSYAYIQASGTDTIDSQVTAVLARNSGQLIERVRYYRGKWFRLDGSYEYVAPPSIGPYRLTSASTTLPESSVSISFQSTSSSLDARVSIGRLDDITIVPAIDFTVNPSSSPRDSSPVIDFSVAPLTNPRD